MKYHDDSSKNYETVSKFVNVMRKILWPLFPDTVYIVSVPIFCCANTCTAALQPSYRLQVVKPNLKWRPNGVELIILVI